MRYQTAEKVNRIPQIFTFAGCLVLGVIFLVLFLTLVDTSIPEDYVEIEGTIVSIEEEFHGSDDDYTYQVFIDYEYDSITYEDVEYSAYNSKMKIGDKVTIYVNPNSPSEFKLDGSDSFIFPLLSGIFAVIGLAGLIINIKKLKENKRSEN